MRSYFKPFTSRTSNSSIKTRCCTSSKQSSRRSLHAPRDWNSGPTSWKPFPLTCSLNLWKRVSEKPFSLSILRLRKAYLSPFASTMDSARRQCKTHMKESFFLLTLSFKKRVWTFCECLRSHGTRPLLRQRRVTYKKTVNILLGAVRDITVLAADNAQRLADLQIKGVFDAAGVKGAHSFVRNGGGDDVDIELDDTNVVQQVHVEAMSDLWKLSSHLRPARNAKDQKRTDGFRGHGRGGGKGGGKGGGRWAPYRNNSYGNYKGGKGRGNGSAPAQAKAE